MIQSFHDFSSRPPVFECQSFGSCYEQFVVINDMFQDVPFFALPEYQEAPLVVFFFAVHHCEIEGRKSQPVGLFEQLTQGLSAPDLSYQEVGNVYTSEEGSMLSPKTITKLTALQSFPKQLVTRSQSASCSLKFEAKNKPKMLISLHTDRVPMKSSAFRNFASFLLLSCSNASKIFRLLCAIHASSVSLPSKTSSNALRKESLHAVARRCRKGEFEGEGGC